MKTYYKSLFVAVITALFIHGAQAQSVTFDFDNAPQYAPLPLDLTAGGITGHFSSGSPFYNYSIQRADVLGFTPPGFSGLCIYPSTVFASDLLVSFDTQLTSASILYSPEEYGTDSSCIMRMTAYLGTAYVGTNTHQIPHGGTWPSGTLSFSSTLPFDNIVIHYDAPPPTGGDYGTIFMADNLIVTPSAVTNPPTVVSRKTHGTAGTFDIPMPLTGPSGVEDRIGGTSGKHTIVFSYTTSPGAATASVTAHDPPTATGLVTRVQVRGNDLIVTLSQVSNAQVLTLSTSGGAVSPVSVPIGFLVGDVDGSRLVDQSDLALTRAQVGQPVTATNFWMDVKPTGVIDNIDMRQVKTQRGTAIP
ncbi:MAG: hypothetical protein ACXWJB_12675 [Limisphaerales bacterium]